MWDDYYDIVDEDATWIDEYDDHGDYYYVNYEGGYGFL